MRPLSALLLSIFISGGSSAETFEVSLNRITNGTEAEIEANRWFMTLVLTSKLSKPPTDEEILVYCGASLVRPNKLLTAAHCYREHRENGGNWMSAFTALFNLRNRCTLDYESSFPITHVAMHPEYSPQVYSNDLAVLTISGIPSAAPITLAPKGNGATPAPAIVLGYGYYVGGQTNEPCTLLQANIRILSRQECLKTQIGPNILNAKCSLCAGSLDGGPDTCQGDSGGPLIKIVHGVAILQGITSFGKGCGKKDSPGAYSDVSCNRAWIDKALATNNTKNTTTTSFYTRINNYIQAVINCVRTRRQPCLLNVPFH